MSGSASMRGCRSDIKRLYVCVIAQVEGKGRIPLALSRMEIGFCKVKSGLLHFRRAAGLSPTGCPFRSRQRRQRKTITCIVMSLQSPEGRLAYIASRANVGCQIRQTQRCARKGYMLIVIGARTDYVICATERSRRPHHDNIRTNPVGLARLVRNGLYGWVVC